MTAVLAPMLLAAILPFPRECQETGGCVTNPPVVEVVDASLPAEGYSLVVAKDGVKIAAPDAAGIFYARQSLAHMGENGVFKCCEIRDFPAYPFRSLMIDEGRHFFGKAFVLRTLEWMARYKLNTLHWHLCEDQGWRLPIDKYPNLTTYGATRRETAIRGRFTGEYDSTKYGPHFYTKADIREITERAAELHIEMIPEIEMPGHTRSILAAYPNLGCPNHKVAERYCWQDWGICEDFVCAGNDDVMKFYREVIDEVCEMFPSRYIHLGGDECSGGSWRKCPRCQARMRTLGFTDVRRLHGWMTEQIAMYIYSKGRIYMGYDDGVRNGAKLDKERTVLMCSSGSAGAIYAAQGFRIVMTPLEYCFWDFHQNIPDDPCVYASWWAGGISLGQVYSFNPAWYATPELTDRMIGCNAYNWTEYSYSPAELEWKMWPRAIAFAQALWNPCSGYSYSERFLPALGPHIARLRTCGVNAANPGLNPVRARSGGAAVRNQVFEAEEPSHGQKQKEQ